MLRIAICAGFAGVNRMVCAIFTRATLCSRILAMALCLSQVGVLSKRMNKSSWFLAWELSSSHPTLR